MMYESDVFHHTYVSSCGSDKFYLIREDSLLQPNTRCYDVCMTHTPGRMSMDHILDILDDLDKILRIFGGSIASCSDRLS